MTLSAYLQGSQDTAGHHVSKQFAGVHQGASSLSVDDALSPVHMLGCPDMRIIPMQNPSECLDSLELLKPHQQLIALQLLGDTNLLGSI